MLRKQKPRFREKPEGTHVLRAVELRAEKVLGGAVLGWGSGPQWLLTPLFESGVGLTAGCSSRSRHHPRETRGGSHHWARGGAPCFSGSPPAFALWLCVSDRAGTWPGRERVGLRTARPFPSRRVGEGRDPPAGKYLVPDQTGATCDDTPLSSHAGVLSLTELKFRSPKRVPDSISSHYKVRRSHPP